MRAAVVLSAFIAAGSISSAYADEVTDKKLGTVNFANSCSASVQDAFQRGVALLHSFQFPRSIAVFNDVLARDPKCAIATWGIAADWIGNTLTIGTTVEDSRQAQLAIDRGRAIGAATQREKDYIEAIATYYENSAGKTYATRMRSLSDAFEALAARYPDDDEAQIFDGLYLASSQSPADKTFARTLKAGGILKAQFARHPDHPGAAHYIIHAFDYPSLASQGIDAAMCYADIAPATSHALHMPSHIFTRIGAWPQSISVNIRSITQANIEKNQGTILHDMDYIEYADLQLGRDTDASEVVKTAPSLSGPLLNAIYALAAIPARYAVERNQWTEAAALADPAQSQFPWTEALVYYARALGAARSGNPAGAAKDIARLEQIRDALKSKSDYWATEVEVQRLTAAAWVAYADGGRDEAFSLMRSAADLESGSEKNAVSPGRILPARELLGDMLRESGHSLDALKAYEASLANDPQRFRSFYGAARAAVALHDPDKARTYYADLVALADPASPRAELTEARAYLASK